MGGVGGFMVLTMHRFDGSVVGWGMGNVPFPGFCHADVGVGHAMRR